MTLRNNEVWNLFRCGKINHQPRPCRPIDIWRGTQSKAARVSERVLVGEDLYWRGQVVVVGDVCGFLRRN